VALQLRKKGIKQVRPLAGGFYGWRDKGYPLVPCYPELEKQMAAG
jgi:rhodanese-related sulfurtransferase